MCLDWHVYVKLTTGKVIGCDFVVSATGTSPNTPCLSTIAPVSGLLAASQGHSLWIPFLV